jgi:hypothetical protein
MIAMAWRVEDGLDLPALRRALKALVARHPALRCTFEWTEGRAIRHLVDRPEAEWTVASPAVAGQGEEVARLHLSAVYRQPIDEFRYPLFRAHAVPGDPAFVLFAIHHLVVDGLSLRIIGRELRSLYSAERAGGTVAVPLAPSYLDFSDAERRRFDDPEVLSSYVSRWRAVLRGRPLIPRFPLDLSISDGAKEIRGRGSKIQMLDIEAWRAFERRCHTHRSTAFVGFLAAYASALRSVTGHDEAGILISLDNRAKGWENSVGWFSNMIPCYWPIPDQPDFAGQLNACRRPLLNILSDHDFPFPRALEQLDPQTYRGNGERYASTVVTFIDDRSEERPDDRDGWREIPLDEGASATFNIRLFTNDEGVGLSCTSLDHSVFEQVEIAFVETVRRWAKEA